MSALRGGQQHPCSAEPILEFSSPERLPQPPPPISSTAILELPCVETVEEGQYTCQAQHPLGSGHVSFSFSVQSELQDKYWGWAAKSGVVV